MLRLQEAMLGTVLHACDLTRKQAGRAQAQPRVNLPADRIKALTARIQDAGTEVVKAKVGACSSLCSQSQPSSGRVSCGCLGGPAVWLHAF